MKRTAEQRARQLAAAMRRNLEDGAAGRVSYSTFARRQRQTWQAATAAGCAGRLSRIVRPAFEAVR